MTKRLVPLLMVAGVVSLVLSLLLGGFIFYQWVLACEATAASIALFVYYLTYERSVSQPTWPPLLPLALIGAAGGAKSFFVATRRDTPLLVIAILVAAVIWFVVASWRIRKAQRNVPVQE